MQNFNRKILLVVAVFLLNGCVIVAGDRDWDSEDWKERQGLNREHISELTLSMNRIDVIEKMGVPNFSEALIKGGQEYRVLYYRTQRTKSDGETSKDETTPLVFKNDKLIGWGAEALKHLD